MNEIKGRVIKESHGHYFVKANDLIYDTQVSGKYRYQAKLNKDYPVVGDYVLFSPVENQKGIIHALVPRQNTFVRKMKISGGRKLKDGKIDGGLTEEQVIAANIDIVFIVSSLDNNFNIRRIERFITLCYHSQLKPVILLNKVDLCNDVNPYLKMIQEITQTIDIHAISPIKDIHMEQVKQYLKKDITAVFLGSSGVGKSTITNYLFKEELMDTKTVSSSNNKGRHTTTSAELITHPEGYSIIDTPGLRELQLWASEDDVDQSFEDVATLIKSCKYSDCKHELEPGCTIREAIANGDLSIERFNSYLKQMGEVKHLSKKQREFERNFNRRNKRNRL